MFTLDAMDGREKYDTIVSTIKQRKRQIEIEVDEWLTHIDSEDISRIAQRLEFSTEVVRAAAYGQVYTQVLKGLEENDEKPKYTWDLRVPHVFQYALQEVLSRSQNPRFSTSPMGNLIHQFTLSAWADVVTLIDDVCHVIYKGAKK